MDVETRSHAPLTPCCYLPLITSTLSCLLSIVLLPGQAGLTTMLARAVRSAGLLRPAVLQRPLG